MSERVHIVEADGTVVELPTTIEPCAACSGTGVKRHVVHLTDEYAEELVDKLEQRLIADDPCPACNGDGRIKVADPERMTEEQYVAFRLQCLLDDEAQEEDEADMEEARRAGLN